MTDSSIGKPNYDLAIEAIEDLYDHTTKPAFLEKFHSTISLLSTIPNDEIVKKDTLEDGITFRLLQTLNFYSSFLDLPLFSRKLSSKKSLKIITSESLRMIDSLIDRGGKITAIVDGVGYCNLFSIQFMTAEDICGILRKKVFQMSLENQV